MSDRSLRLRPVAGIPRVVHEDMAKTTMKTWLVVLYKDDRGSVYLGEITAERRAANWVRHAIEVACGIKAITDNVDLRKAGDRPPSRVTIGILVKCGGVCAKSKIAARPSN